MTLKRTLIIMLVAVVSIMAEAFTASAQNIVRKRLVNPDSIPDELVLVGEDTVHMIIPERNYGRFDRGLFNWLYVP